MLSKILILIALFISGISFAQETNNSNHNELINEIVANENACIVGYSEDRIYLNPNRIFPTEQGLYLNLNDIDYMLLPALNSDSQGCFIPVIQILPLCPGCNQEYFISCKNPDCPLVNQKKEREKERDRKKEEYRKEKRKGKK